MMKRIISLFISFFFLVTYKLFTLLLSLCKKKLPGRLVILMYHTVKPYQRERFASQLDILIKKCNPVFANIIKKLKNGQNYVAVTFDDGFQCVVENALPELNIREIPVTLFIPTGFLGKNLSWDKNTTQKYSDKLIISAEQLKNLNSNLITIGSHSVTHSNLTLLSEENIKKELVESKNRLEIILNKEITLLAFPYGEYNKNVLDISKKTGYKRVFSTLPTSPFYRINAFLLGRINVSPDDWFIEFRLKLLGAYQWLPLAVLLKRKLKNQIRKSYSLIENLMKLLPQRK